MFRALCVAVALAMTPAGATAAAGAHQELPAAWAASYLPLPAGWEFIEVGGWTLIEYNDETLAFVAASRRPMHIWVRKEFNEALLGRMRSARDLIEVDCSAGRIRSVARHYFALNNLAQGIDFIDEVKPWTSPAPGTIADVPLRVLCD